MSKKYFKLLLKTFSPVLIVFAVICAFTYIVTPTASVTTDYLTSIDYVAMVSTSSMATLGAAVIPFLLHHRYYTKNSSDIYLSLPLSRKQAFLTENIFGLGGILAITTIAYLVGAISTLGFAAVAEKAILNPFSDIILLLPLILMEEAITYIISMTAVSIANSQNEAFFLTAFLHTIPALLYVLFLAIFFKSIGDFPDWTLMMFYGPGSFAATVSKYSLEDYFLTIGSGFENYLASFLVLFANLLASIGVGYFALRQFQKLKSEHLGTAQMEKYGSINVFVVASFLDYTFMGMLIGYIMIGVSYLSALLFVIYFLVLVASIIAFWIMVFMQRRKIRFLKEDLIRFAIATVPALILGVIIYAICIR